ncbi:hypothetical protein EYC80_004535 [Monilinia laxa]|uniref:Uncharacterized protein n=1 Tax=Monilinia laxa TaxID=61186 RepID=A0A5N6KHA5_MONLA|nr:hypothetical protein EYC80_004535 [Monilinia laxa]
MWDQLARKFETRNESFDIPESGTEAQSSTLAFRSRVSQSPVNQNINTDSIVGLSSNNVERSGHTAQPQVAGSHRSQQHFNLHAHHDMMRSISPPQHNYFPLENSSTPTKYVDFDKLTDYAAYRSSEVKTELGNIPSNQENASLHAEYFKLKSEVSLIQTVDRQETEHSFHTPDTTFHSSQLQAQDSQIISAQVTRQLTDEDDSTFQELRKSYVHVLRNVPSSTTAPVVSQSHLLHAVPQASQASHEHQLLLSLQSHAHNHNSRQLSPQSTPAATAYQQQHASPLTEITSSKNSPRSSIRPPLKVKSNLRIHSFIIAPARPLRAASLIVNFKLPQHKVAEILSKPSSPTHLAPTIVASKLPKLISATILVQSPSPKQASLVVRLKFPGYNLAHILAQPQQYESPIAQHTETENKHDGEENYSKDDDNEYIDSESDESARKKKKTPRKNAKTTRQH